MNDSSSNPRQIEQYFQDLEDGCITADDHRALTALLKEQPGVRTRFLEHMAFASALHGQAAAIAGIEGRRIMHPLHPPQRKAAKRAIAWTVAAVLTLIFVGSWIETSRRQVASVVAGPGTIWQFVSGGPAPGGFTPNTRVTVSQGTLEMTTPAGTRVLLEGPAEFSWLTARETTLDKGQAWIAVAKGDEGFSVRMPTVSVTDLGTEFGVLALAGEDQVHVATGRVRMTPRFPHIPWRELVSNEAAATNAVGQIRGIPCDPGRFLRNLSVNRTLIRWSFDQTSNDSFLSEASGIPAYPLTVPGRVPVLTEGRFGNAFDMEATRNGAVSGFPGIAGTTPRSIALWIKGSPIPEWRTVNRREISPSLVDWGLTRGGWGNKWNLASLANGRRIVLHWGDSWVSAEVPGGGSLFDGDWHHVAVVYTGELHDGIPDIRFYFDGQRIPEIRSVGMAPINTLLDSPQSQPLAVGVLRGYPEIEDTTLPLAIDELLIARFALNDEEVARLYETNEIEPE